MEKILFRKLLSDYLIFFIIALLSAATVIWVFQAVNFLDIMVDDGRDYLVYLNYALLNFPKIVSKIFPFILFFSLYYVTIKYELSNELIIFWNYGIHKIEIINFILKFSIFLTFFQIILNSYVVPITQDLARTSLRMSSVNFLDNFVRPQKFNDTIKGLTIYADKKNKNGDLENLYIKKEISKNEFQITYAKRGKFDKMQSQTILILFNGATITSKNDKITNISFSKSDFSLKNLQTNTTTYKKTQELNSFKLFKCIDNFYKHKKDKFELVSKNIENCSLKNIQNIFKEIYKRFIIPFYIPILSIIPLILIVSSKESSNYQKLRYFTFAFGFIIIIFSETTIRFISENLIQNIIFFLTPVILLIFSYLYFFSKFNYLENKN